MADLAKNEVTDLRLPCEVPWEETRKRFPPDLDAPDMRCLEGMSVFVCSSVVGAESGTPLGDLSGGGSIHLHTQSVGMGGLRRGGGTRVAALHGRAWMAAIRKVQHAEEESGTAACTGIGYMGGARGGTRENGAQFVGAGG